MLYWKRISLAVALCALIAVPSLVGCNFLVYQFCITNNSPYDLVELNIVPSSDPSWGANQLNELLAPGGEVDVPGYPANTYDVRAAFSIHNFPDPEFCTSTDNSEYIATNTDLEITTTNICIDYDTDIANDPDPCTVIYGTPHFEI